MVVSWSQRATNTRVESIARFSLSPSQTTLLSKVLEAPLPTRKRIIRMVSTGRLEQWADGNSIVGGKTVYCLVSSKCDPLLPALVDAIFLLVQIDYRVALLPRTRAFAEEVFRQRNERSTSSAFELQVYRCSVDLYTCCFIEFCTRTFFSLCYQHQTLRTGLLDVIVTGFARLDAIRMGLYAIDIRRTNSLTLQLI